MMTTIRYDLRGIPPWNASARQTFSSDKAIFQRIKSCFQFVLLPFQPFLSVRLRAHRNKPMARLTARLSALVSVPLRRPRRAAMCPTVLLAARQQVLRRVLRPIDLRWGDAAARPASPPIRAVLGVKCRNLTNFAQGPSVSCFSLRSADAKSQQGRPSGLLPVQSQPRRRAMMSRTVQPLAACSALGLAHSTDWRVSPRQRGI